jgi:hypothetical protein
MLTRLAEAYLLPLNNLVSSDLLGENMAYELRPQSVVVNPGITPQQAVTLYPTPSAGYPAGIIPYADLLGGVLGLIVFMLILLLPMIFITKFLK